jgi:ribonuclease HII
MKKESVTLPLYRYDLSLASGGFLRIGGMDEAGRGPLCGPVVTACCVMDLSKGMIEGVNDSKKVSEKRRERLFDEIIAGAVAYEVAAVDNERIDEINILEATKEGMYRCLNALKAHMDICVTDAVNLHAGVPVKPLIHGDAISYTVACASILAKVTRDRIIREYDALYPEYNLKKHKGYGTKEHTDAIKIFGLSPIHRKTFCKKI